MAKNEVTINRAPVLTLWASIVAERLGNKRATALTLGKAVAGLNAQSKGELDLSKIRSMAKRGKK